MNNSAQPSVTVVIPVYQRVGVLSRALDSVWAQTFRPLKLIVVDNNSTDGSLELAHTWARSHQSSDFEVRVLTETTPGAAAARNCGLKAVDTEWTMFFDSDDIMHSDHIEKAVGAVSANSPVDLVGWDIMLHDANGNHSVRPFEPSEIGYHNLMHGSLATQRYFARTELFRKAGGWNATVSVWNDIELGSRLLLLCPRCIKRTGAPTVDVFHTRQSITGEGFSHNLKACQYTLSLMRQTYPSPSHVDIKEAMLLGDCAIEGCGEAHVLFDGLLSKIASCRTRVLCRIAYYGRRMRVRGLARILYPLMPK